MHRRGIYLLPLSHHTSSPQNGPRWNRTTTRWQVIYIALIFVLPCTDDEQCDLDHVEITNSPITEFTETGILTEDGKLHEFDVVAVCTGYDAVTGGLRTMGIKGRDGLDLDEKWKDGVVTNVGMIVNGYPNMFM